MFSLVISLRTSLKTAFVKEYFSLKININVACAYSGSSLRAAHVSTRQAILALAAAVFFSLDYP